MEVKSTDDLRDLLANDQYNFRFEYGHTKPIHQMDLNDATALVKAVWLHVVFCTPHVELLQLQKGFRETLQMKLLVCRYSAEVHSMLAGSSKFEITPDYLLDSLVIMYSPQGSNKRTSEEAIILNWTDYVQECQGNPVSLGDIAQFMSGSSKLPAAGFDRQPSIQFTDDVCLPKASTCDVSITFPRSFGSLQYDEFKEKNGYVHL